MRVDLLCAFHARLFAGVRNHAGRLRTSDSGSEWLTFGPNRSAHRNQVPEMLEHVCDAAARKLRRLAETPSAEGFELAAIDLAVRLHADIICIHPFEDGNGRTSRMLLNWNLLQVGLMPIALEVPKAEYRDCLNHYFSTKQMGPLLHLYTRLLNDATP